MNSTFLLIRIHENKAIIKMYFISFEDTKIVPNSLSRIGTFYYMFVFVTCTIFKCIENKLFMKIFVILVLCILFMYSFKINIMIKKFTLDEKLKKCRRNEYK